MSPFSLVRSLVFISLLVMFFYSCKKKSCYRDFTDEDKKQLVYSGGETIVFKSNINFVDTIFCSLIAKNNGVMINHCGEEDRQSLRLCISNSGSILGLGGCCLSVLQPYADEGPPKPKLDLYGNFNDWQMPKAITINNKQVANVYRINSPGPGHYFNCIYWSFDYGILRFDKSNGEVWERVNF